MCRFGIVITECLSQKPSNSTIHKYAKSFVYSGNSLDMQENIFKLNRGGNFKVLVKEDLFSEVPVTSCGLSKLCGLH